MEPQPRQSAIHNRQSIFGRRVPSPAYDITLALSPDDGARNLITSPVLNYSTYWGGSGYDAANAITVDAAGNTYVTGQTNSVDFPTTARTLASGVASCGSPQDGLPCFDVFVTKFSATGSVVYSVYFGGSQDDRGTGIAVDSDGNAYVAGITNSADFPTAYPFQPNLTPGNCGSALSPIPCYDSFIVKLNPSGDSLVYSTFLGGSGQDLAAGIALDGLGQATVAGSTSSRDFPTSVGAMRGNFGGGTLDAFVTRLDSTGSRAVFSTYLGGSDEDRGLAVAVNAAGETIVAGSTASSDFPALDGIQMTNAGGSCGSATSPVLCTDAFVARLSASGTGLVYSTYLGGTGGDTANAIALDSVGAVYVAGSTTSTDFPTTPGSFQRTGGGTSVDAFVAKLSPDGSPLVYSTYFGGIGQEEAYGIAVDSGGNALVTGYANDSAFPVANPIQNSGGKFYDAFVNKFNAAGSALIFSTLMGGSGYEAGQGIGVDAAGNAYIVGWTFSEDFPTASAIMPSYGGGSYDAFVAKLCGLQPLAVELSRSSVTFADQGVTTASAPQSLVLSNIGLEPLSISKIAVSGDFRQSNNCGAQLALGATCEAQIVFAPTQTGTRRGMLTITDDALDSPQTVALAGTGVPAFSLQAVPDLATVVVGTATASFTVAASSAFDYQQSISLACENGSLVQCAFDPVNITPGNNSALTVGGFPESASAAISFRVNGTSENQLVTLPLTVMIGDYSVSATPPVVSVVAGRAATFTLAAQSLNGFNQPVSIDCSGAPALAACQAFPAAVTPGPSSQATVSISVTTTAPASSPWRGGPGRVPPLGGSWRLLALLFFVCALLFSQNRTNCARRIAWSAAGVVLLLSAACGGGGQSPVVHRAGTPAGKYELKFTGNSGGLVRSTTVTLEVN